MESHWFIRMRPFRVHNFSTELFGILGDFKFSPWIMFCFVLLDTFYIEIKYLLQSSSDRIWMHNCTEVPWQPSKVQSSSYISEHSRQSWGGMCLAESKTSSSSYSCHVSLVAASHPPQSTSVVSTFLTSPDLWADGKTYLPSHTKALWRLIWSPRPPTVCNYKARRLTLTAKRTTGTSRRLVKKAGVVEVWAMRHLEQNTDVI